MAASRPVRRGQTQAEDSAEAIDELRKQLELEEAALTVLFCSPTHDRARMTAVLQALAPSTGPLLACTTAGEIGPLGYREHGMSAFSLDRSHFVVELVALPDPKSVTIEKANEAVLALKHRMAARTKDCDSHCFALLFVDGLSVSEESLAYKLQRALGSIPLVGGSAGDALNFGETFLYCGDSFKQDQAVLTLVHTERSWEAFKAQHFLPSDKKIVVTAAAPEKRIVDELDGEPAAEALAELVGVPSPQHLTQAVLARNPLMVQLGGNWFIRSVQRVNDDGSLTVYCAIEEGLVLSLGRGECLLSQLEQTFGGLRERLGPLEVTLVFDCMQRRLELINTDSLEAGSTIMRANNAVGFSTYGEQFGGLHINQTLTGIAVA